MDECQAAQQFPEIISFLGWLVVATGLIGGVVLIIAIIFFFLKFTIDFSKYG